VFVTFSLLGAYSKVLWFSTEAASDCSIHRQRTKIPKRNNLKEEKVTLARDFRLQSLVTWFCASGPLVGQNTTLEGMVGENCSLHGS
jgi:hypothetical protein